MKIARINQSKELLIKGELIESNIDRTRLHDNGNIETFEYIEGAKLGIKNNKLLGLELIELAQLEMPFSPADIPNLKMWLDATSLNLTNGDKVETWNDLSGLNNNAIQSDYYKRPNFMTNVLNGKPVVRSWSSNGFLEFSRITDIRTVFIVFCTLNPNVVGHIFGDYTAYDWHNGNDNGKLFAAYANAYVRNGDGRVNNVPVTVTNIINPTGGVFKSVSIRTTGNVVANTISNDRGLANRCWVGDYAEILVYNRALTDGEIGDMNNYLMDKWGLM